MSAPCDDDGKDKSTDSGKYDVEKVARILSLIAIPVVLAVVGWLIQNRLTEQNLSQEYVKLAVSILEKPKASESPAGLRDWAVDLLSRSCKIHPAKLIGVVIGCRDELGIARSKG